MQLGLQVCTSKVVFNILIVDKNRIFSPFCYQKVCKSAIAHHTPKNKRHTCTLRTLFIMDFTRIRTFATHPLAFNSVSYVKKGERIKEKLFCRMILDAKLGTQFIFMTAK